MNRAIAGVLALLLLTGCATLSSVLPILIGDDDQPSTPVCVAHYEDLGPSTELGMDGCGNFWLKYNIGAEPECFIRSAGNDSMLRIPCPAEGDTLGD